MQLGKDIDLMIVSIAFMIEPKLLGVCLKDVEKVLQHLLRVAMVQFEYRLFGLLSLLVIAGLHRS